MIRSARLGQRSQKELCAGPGSAILRRAMFEVPLHEIASPEEQLAVARCVAIVAAHDGGASAAERRFVEELMAKMMLLPAERDLVRREFGAPGDITSISEEILHREARVFLLYQAICVAFADNELEEREFRLLMQLAQAFDFDPEAAEAFVFWVRDALELSGRGQELIVSL